MYLKKREYLSFSKVEKKNLAKSIVVSLIYLCVLQNIVREQSEDKAWRTQPPRQHRQWRRDQFSVALHLLLNLCQIETQTQKMKAPCTVVGWEFSVRFPGIAAELCYSVINKFINDSSLTVILIQTWNAIFRVQTPLCISDRCFHLLVFVTFSVNV